MFYQSVLTYGFDWKDKYAWEIEVKCGKFDTIAEAARFGHFADWLRHPVGANHLLLLDGEGIVHTIEPKGVVIKELKAESQELLMRNEKFEMDESDFEIVEISEEDFLNLPLTYGSLSYGVIDERGEGVLFDTPSSLDKKPRPTNNVSEYPQSFESYLESLSVEEIVALGERMRDASEFLACVEKCRDFLFGEEEG